MTQRATIPGTVLLLEVYTQIRSELEPAATTKWLCSILECWSSTNIASLLVELFEESDRFTSHLEQCVPSLLKQLDHRPCRRTSAPLASLPATTLPSQLRPSLPLSITVAAKAWNRSTYLQPTKLRHLCCSQLTTFCHMHASNVSSMHSISLLLEADATLELLCELLASGGTQVALLLLQLTPHTATFHQCLRMVTSVTAYLDADIVVATASCSCYRTLSTHDLDVSTSNNSNLVCRLTSTCMHQQHQLAIALEMGCLASELYHPAHMMDLSEELPSRERCLSSPASDTSDDAVSLCELP